MAEKFDEFLEEVQNDIRQEKLLQLWKQYGKLVMGFMAGIIFLVAGYKVWSHYEQNKRMQMAEKLIAAQDYLAKGDMDKAQTLLNTLGTESHDTYQPLALFQKAGLLLKGNPKPQPSEALAIYTQLSENSNVVPLWRDLAALLAVMVSVDQEATNQEALSGQLEKLTDDQNPWRYFAREMKGILLHRQGNKSQAQELFARLVQDSQTPAGISMRARLMVQIISTEMKD